MKKTLSSQLYLKIQIIRDEKLSKIADFLISLKITGNQVTFFRMFLYVPVFLSIGYDLRWLFVLIFLGFFLDALDGLIARKTQQSTKYGEMLDFLVDKLQLIPVIIGLIFYGFADFFWSILYLAAFVITTLIFYVKDKTFNWSRYLLYLAVFLLFINIDLIDVVLVFLSFFQTIILMNNFKNRYVRK